MENKEIRKILKEYVTDTKLYMSNNMKHKNMKTFEEHTSELNISDVSNSVFSITEEQLEELIEKVKDKITDTLDKEGKSTKGSTDCL